MTYLNSGVFCGWAKWVVGLCSFLLAIESHLNGPCWCFILDISDDLLRVIRESVSMMTKIMRIIMKINRILANMY